MKDPKQTKEELLIEISELKNSRDTYANNDVRLRREFAKAFNWTIMKSIYDRTEEAIIPSWEQIFVEMGKLLEKEVSVKLSDELHQLKVDINTINEMLNAPSMEME